MRSESNDLIHAMQTVVFVVVTIPEDEIEDVNLVILFLLILLFCRMLLSPCCFRNAFFCCIFSTSCLFGPLVNADFLLINFFS